MPWRECHKMDERLRFVARLLDGEKMAVLCREFEISRKTASGSDRRGDTGQQDRSGLSCVRHASCPSNGGGQSALTAPGGGAKPAASLKIHSRKAFTFGADAVRRGRTNQ